MSSELSCPLCLRPQVNEFAQFDQSIYFRCADCDLTFMHPSLHLAPQDERERYLLHENNPGDLRYREFLNRLARPMIDRLKRNAVGLDYGSGPGPTLSVMLEEEGFLVNVYDPHFSPNHEALSRTYDFVTCTETAEHFYRPHQEFQRFNELLNPGGWLGVMTDPMTEADNFKDWHYRHDPTHVSFYSLKSLSWIANHLGWSLEQISQTVFMFQKPGQE